MILALALALDAALGEPDWLWRRLPHPAVLMGRAVEALERRWNTRRRLPGVAAMVVLVGGAGLIGWALAEISPILSVVVAAVLLAQRSLVQHVRAVADAVRRGLPEGRRAVAQIVGRDTTDMDEAQICRAAIESAAENLGDGVVAPVFWFAVAGLPGMLIYKVVNTADSTVGYRTPRYEAYGWAAARLDDALNWLPARLTALLIVAVGPGRWNGVAADAARHRSPNAGWPEAAMARVLGIALSGPRSYDGRSRDYAFVNAEGRREAGPRDVDAATAILWKMWGCLLVLALIAGGIGWLAGPPGAEI